MVFRDPCCTLDVHGLLLLRTYMEYVHVDEYTLHFEWDRNIPGIVTPPYDDSQKINQKGDWQTG